MLNEKSLHLFCQEKPYKHDGFDTNHRAFSIAKKPYGTRVFHTSAK